MERENIQNRVDQLTVRQVQILLEKLGYSQDVEVLIK
jgi:hypothetical protein